jgi:hypothetical protein
MSEYAFYYPTIPWQILRKTNEVPHLSVLGFRNFIVPKEGM